MCTRILAPNLCPPHASANQIESAKATGQQQHEQHNAWLRRTLHTTYRSGKWHVECEAKELA